jgi:hypothetical protein
MNDQTHDFVLWAITSIVTMLPVAVDMELGSNPTSLIIRLSNELRDAQASLRPRCNCCSRPGGDAAAIEGQPPWLITRFL